jgi:hypothetical protein
MQFCGTHVSCVPGSEWFQVAILLILGAVILLRKRLF